jgi:hypothetical protein
MTTGRVGEADRDNTGIGRLRRLAGRRPLGTRFDGWDAVRIRAES